MALAAVMPVVVTYANAQGANPYLNKHRSDSSRRPVRTVYPSDGSGSAAASYGSLSPLAQQEMIRRQDRVHQADEALKKGRKFYSESKYEEAVQEYRRALDLLPDSPMLSDRKAVYRRHLTDGSVALSQQYRRHGGRNPENGGKGTYDDARDLLNEVLKDDPDNVRVKRELAQIDDPIRTNPALTYEHTKNIDEVRRALYTGEGAFNLGDYDKAKKNFEKVLRVDPYNKAARRWLERVAAAKSDYYRAAYDHTRAELLAQVDAAWELAVPRDIPATFGGGDGKTIDSYGSSYILNKLRTINIPVVDFEDTSVEEAIDFLRQRSIELDTLETDPAHKGVNFVIRKPRVEGGDSGADAGADGLGLGLDSQPGAQRISELRLRNVPLATVLKYICDATKLRYKVDDFAVNIVPGNESAEDLTTRSFRVPPGFIADLEGGGSDAGGGDVDPFNPGGGGGGAGNLLKPRASVEQLLKNKGVPFPEGASASFSSGTGTLVIRNTPTNIDLIEQLVIAAQVKTPKQIKILTKFVEITQENSDELGFDWIVSPFGLNANELFLGGGTIGNGVSRNKSDFISPVNNTSIPGIPAMPGTNVRNIVTGGNRSGAGAISRNSIDAIRNNPNRTAQNASVAPGILSLTGLFSDGQVQVIMRGLSLKKGADIMTAPSVTARPGQKATIEIIREFIYPTEYEPPELPNSVGTNGNNGGIGGAIGGGGGGTFPVTPATPTAFETRNTGVTLEIEPNLADNDYVIDLRFAPEIVEFEGFINYGSPIQSSASDALGNPTTVTITENRIEMPVFSTRRVNTALTIYDGYTVAVGGLMAESVQNVEDKVPILGDIPIIGRLFQSKAENRIKSNLIIFVTASIIDATGQPISRSKDDTALGGDPAMMGGDAGVLPPIN
jgi:general secretion pathway protein D